MPIRYRDDALEYSGEKLRVYESRYGMPSDLFYALYMLDRLDIDSVDGMNWAAFYEMRLWAMEDIRGQAVATATGRGRKLPAIVSARFLVSEECLASIS